MDFASPDSDYDLRGVHVLPVKQVVSLEDGQQTIDFTEFRENLELDLVTHDVKKFVRLMLKKQWLRAGATLFASNRSQQQMHIRLSKSLANSASRPIIGTIIWALRTLNGNFSISKTLLR